ncbi:MAG: hypothetical protein D6765_01380, partial [Bacteroidetes bacterium]
QCSMCGQSHPAGKPCNCGREQPIPIDVKLMVTSAGAQILRRLRRQLYTMSDSEIITAALNVYEMHLHQIEGE